MGGGRIVLRQFLEGLIAILPDDLAVTCFVRRSDDLPLDPRIEYVEPKLPRNSWLARLWFETFGLANAVAKRPVDIFVSLQGSGARIAAHHRFIYCHNALPLVDLPPEIFQGARQIRLMSGLYDLLYRFTIRPGDWVIVQQGWVRDAFRARYGHRRAIVAHPVHGVDPPTARALPDDSREKFGLLYPLSPYAYKNAEVACEAIALLEAAAPGRFKLTLTIRGDENAYAARLLERYEGCPAIRFVGPLSHDRLLSLYGEIDLLVFPSLVETWGLPISEAKEAGVPILAADLPYAHETIGDYAAADFFDAHDANALAKAIHGCWSGKRPLGPVSQPLPAEPFAPDWKALAALVVRESTLKYRQANLD